MIFRLTKSAWLLYGLHLLMALSLPLVLSFMLSCKQAKAKREDLGPEVPTTAINDALDSASALGSTAPLSVGQKLVFSETRRIESEETATLIGTRNIEVVQKRDSLDGKTTKFTLLITNSERMSDGTFQTAYGEENNEVKKPAGAEVTSGMFADSIGGNQLTAENLARIHADSTDDKPDKITFHHLNISDDQIDPPASVSGRANCEGLSPCKLHVRFLQFEMVLWHGEDYQKISFDFAFSGDTPHLPFGTNYFSQQSGALIADCRSTYVNIESRTVYVRDCLALDDFLR